MKKDCLPEDYTATAVAWIDEFPPYNSSSTSEYKPTRDNMHAFYLNYGLEAFKEVLSAICAYPSGYLKCEKEDKDYIVEIIKSDTDVNIRFVDAVRTLAAVVNRDGEAWESAWKSDCQSATTPPGLPAGVIAASIVAVASVLLFMIAAAYYFCCRTQISSGNGFYNRENLTSAMNEVKKTCSTFFRCHKKGYKPIPDVEVDAGAQSTTP